MDEQYEQKIEQWLEKYLPSLSASGALSVHVDNLLGRSLGKPETLRVSLNALSVLWLLMQRRQAGVKFGLVIPLHSPSPQLSANAPTDLGEIEQQLSDEPPSLFLIGRNAFESQEIFEEYKRPLFFELVPNVPQAALTYYREFRDITYLRNGWEFSRCVYIEYAHGK
jgi:hypothetical protein